MAEEYKNIWEKRIKEAFKRKKINNEDELWDIVHLILYENSHDRLLVDLYHTLDKENFIKVISLLDGRTFKSPSKKQMEETLLLAVFYYEKEVEGKTWEQIQSEYDFEIPTIKYGIRIKNLDNWIKQRMQEIMRRGDSNG